MKKLKNTVYVNNPDRYLSLDGENLVIKQDDEEIGRVPLHNIERIVTFGHTGASPALMGKCAADGIDLIFMDMHGNFLARIEGKVKGNVLLRRQQYRYADNEEKSLGIAKNIIRAKLYNSRWVLERTIRDNSMRIDIDKFRQKTAFLQESIKNSYNAVNMDSLRGIEGEAASVYFSVFDDMILRQKEEFFFKKRSKRPPLDNVNALLSLIYSQVTKMCTHALECVGLDPYVGFMHTERPGKPSLALDLVEEFRAALCDRFILKLINMNMIKNDDFIQREDGVVWLTEDGRKAFFSAWKNKLYDEIRHPFLEEKVEWGMIPYTQAMLLARYIRGDLDEYPPFTWK